MWYRITRGTEPAREAAEVVAKPKPKSRGGRPRTREPQPGHRIIISVRVTARLKALLDEAAERSGRSLSQEAEFRLEQTFSRIVEAVGTATATLRPSELVATARIGDDPTSELLHDRLQTQLAEAATTNHRSLDQEIVSRLRRSLFVEKAAQIAAGEKSLFPAGELGSSPVDVALSNLEKATAVLAGRLDELVLAKSAETEAKASATKHETPPEEPSK